MTSYDGYNIKNRFIHTIKMCVEITIIIITWVCVCLTPDRRFESPFKTIRRYHWYIYICNGYIFVHVKIVRPCTRRTSVAFFCIRTSRRWTGGTRRVFRLRVAARHTFLFPIRFWIFIIFPPYICMDTTLFQTQSYWYDVRPIHKTKTDSLVVIRTASVRPSDVRRPIMLLRFCAICGRIVFDLYGG